MAVLEVKKETFEQEVLKSDKPVLVDFWADWCGPCKMIAPTLEELESEVSHVKICKIDVDTNQELAVKYGIMSIPALVLFEKGSVVKKLEGVQSKTTLLNFVQ